MKVFIAIMFLLFVMQGLVLTFTVSELNKVAAENMQLQEQIEYNELMCKLFTDGKGWSICDGE